jgi:hypothetical protein
VTQEIRLRHRVASLKSHKNAVGCLRSQAHGLCKEERGLRKDVPKITIIVHNRIPCKICGVYSSVK